MELLVVMWIILGIAAVLMLLVVKYAVRHKHFVFFFVYCQAFVYLNLAPTLSIGQYRYDDALLYVYLQVASVFLFELPLIIFYFKIFKKTTNLPSSSPAVFIDMPRCYFLLFITLSLSAVYVYMLVSSDYIFTRIGSEQKALKVVEMSSSSIWIVARYSEKISPILLCMIMVMRKNLLKSKERWLAFAVLGVGIVAFGVPLLINSKLSFIFFLSPFVMLYLYENGAFLIFKGTNLRVAFVVGFIVVYGMGVTANFRSDYFYHNMVKSEFFLSWLYEKKSVYAPDKATDRLNGLDLMVLITPKMNSMGPALGKAWENPIFLFFGTLLDKKKADEIKSNYNTNAKNYLIDKYTNIQTADYYSCVLTDLYGNFWLFGFIFAGIFFALIIAWVQRIFELKIRTWHFIVGVYIFIVIQTFDSEFIGMVANAVQMVPALLFVFFVNPIQQHYLGNNA